MSELQAKLSAVERLGGRSGEEKNVTDRISKALLSIALLAASFAAVRANNALPPTAPSIQRNNSGSDQEQTKPLDEPGTEKTVVKTRPPPQPLLGGITRAGALTGGVDYMVAVPPGLTAKVNQTVLPEVFRGWIEKAHPQIIALRATLTQGDVLVVKGQWDDSGRTLDKFGIPYQRIAARSMKDIPLDEVKVLCVDCAGDLPKQSFQRVRDWVARGGYLLTTDWALDSFLQKSFPGYVQWSHKTNRDGIYLAEAFDPDPALFRNAVPVANWRMEIDCHLLEVLKPDRVRVLVRSPQLAREDGLGILAVTFPFGRGQVLHLVGHFDNNPMTFHFGNNLPDPAPVIGISLRQAIAGNFVYAALSGARVPGH